MNNAEVLVWSVINCGLSSAAIITTVTPAGLGCKAITTIVSTMGGVFGSIFAGAYESRHDASRGDVSRGETRCPWPPYIVKAKN